MTNEQFIKCLNILQTAVKNADSEVMSQIVEHAKKLVAVAEAAKVIENYYWHYSEGDSVDIFKTALKDLERE